MKVKVQICTLETDFWFFLEENSLYIDLDPHCFCVKKHNYKNFFSRIGKNDARYCGWCQLWLIRHLELLLFSLFFSATIFYEHSLTFVWRQREILLNFYEHEAINWRRCIYFPFSCSRKIKIKEIPGKKAKAPVSYVTWIVSMYSICLLHHNSPVNAFPQASLFRCNFEYTKT